MPSSRSIPVTTTRKGKPTHYLREENKGVVASLVNVATGIPKIYNQETIGLN